VCAVKAPLRRPAWLLAALCAGSLALMLAAGTRADDPPAPAYETVTSAVRGPSRATTTPVQWCGGDQLSTDRPDVLGGNQVHVIYAVASDAPDQFSTFVHRIVTDLGEVDAWWRRQDPTRTPRFDLAPFANCTTMAGQIDVSFVRLPHPSSTFLTLGSNLSAIAADLAALHLDADSKRYLVYYDGPTNDNDVCGISFRDPTGTGGGEFVAAIWMRACRPDLGAGDVDAAVAAHELLHSLGTLPRGAPHPCRNDDGHPCDSRQDLMYPLLSDHFANLQLDVGRDDYYGHTGNWLDIQDSRWLMRADVAPSALTVAVQPRSPQDKVVSDPVGIGCPSACAVLFDTGSQVRLTATPGSGSRFSGWTGACTGATATCTVTMDAAKTVQAVFAPSTFLLSLAVTGKGAVSAPALRLACTRRCSAAVEAATLVRIRATPAKSWRFLRWSGACGGRGACAVTVSASRSVTAVFQRIPVKKKKAKS
jgi:hypothetical protein